MGFPATGHWQVARPGPLLDLRESQGSRVNPRNLEVGVSWILRASGRAECTGPRSGADSAFDPHPPYSLRGDEIMSRTHRPLRALAFLFALFPLWWLQSTHANPMSTDRGPHGGNPSKSVQPAGDDGSRHGDSNLPGDGDDDGCTLTLGYWKNHSAHASNPNQNIPWPISEETLLCGETWFDILHAPAGGGNTWLILAHQWIAAKLNEASGASTDVLGGALDEAGDLLANNCGGLSGDDQDRAIELASLLDDYNNGVIGPGHCGDITDCNGNGIDDAIDIENGTSQDTNQNGIPDECEGSITDYCNGWGAQNGGVDCPCGNTSTPGSPAGCVNSSGQGASLTGTGVPSISQDTVVLTATGVPVGHVSFFIYSLSSSQSGSTFGSGKRCLRAPFTRIHKISSSTGSDVFPVPNTLPISQQLGITAGTLTFFQVFYRDSGPCSGGGANATNALAISWAP
jgi:hypothetical protein